MPFKQSSLPVVPVLADIDAPPVPPPAPPPEVAPGDGSSSFCPLVPSVQPDTTTSSHAEERTDAISRNRSQAIGRLSS
jgi:hypothetical protein